jgi:hypothetical protein
VRGDRSDRARRLEIDGRFYPFPTGGFTLLETLGIAKITGRPVTDVMAALATAAAGGKLDRDVTAALAWVAAGRQGVRIPVRAARTMLVGPHPDLIA